MTETGLASWYGPKFQGKLTASGEVFNQELFTAAHPTLPWGSRVKVINLDNGKSVDVRINDRGPFKRGRIIDVSRAAARALGMVGRGITTVRIEWLADSEKTDELALQDIGAGLPRDARGLARSVVYPKSVRPSVSPNDCSLCGRNFHYDSDALSSEWLEDQE